MMPMCLALRVMRKPWVADANDAHVSCALCESFGWELRKLWAGDAQSRLASWPTFQ